MQPPSFRSRAPKGFAKKNRGPTSNAPTTIVTPPFAGSRPFDETAIREIAARAFDRTTNLASGITNHAGIDTGDRWRERLGEVGAPTLVIHGTEDPMFPYGNAVALAKEIPGARLLALERVGHEAPPRDLWGVVVPAILRHTASAP